MGYNTAFLIEFDDDNHEAFTAACEYLSYDVEYYNEAWHGDGKWYEHERDFKALSEQFPDKLIIVTGHGEDIGDSWRKYFKYGKMQEARATFAPFEESKLK